MGSEIGSVMGSEVGGRVSEGSEMCGRVSKGGGIGSEVDGRFSKGAKGVGISSEVSGTDVGCSEVSWSFARVGEVGSATSEFSVSEKRS